MRSWFSEEKKGKWVIEPDPDKPGKQKYNVRSVTKNKPGKSDIALYKKHGYRVRQVKSRSQNSFGFRW